MRLPMPRLQGHAGRQRRPKRDEPTDAYLLKSAAIIARYLPGIGNPLDMDMSDLDVLMEVVNDIVRMEGGSGSGSGAGDHRARVEEQMRRLHG